MRFRCGQWGTSNVVIGGIGLLALAALLVVAIGIMVTGGGITWSAVGVLGALFGMFLTGSWFATGVTTWRPVRLDPGVLSVPGFSWRRGFYRVAVPIDEVNGVTLEHYFSYRNSRWQLRVGRRYGGPLTCDSINSSRSEKKGVAGTRAQRVVDELSAAIKAAQSG